MLVLAEPRDSSIHFTGNRIQLSFDEYVDVQNTFENVVVSPLPNNIPVITYHYKNVSIKIKDTLEPNTTYSINFGNSIKDVNEGNILKQFTYVFSTGDHLDENSISGKVIVAETGEVDSTLIVVLQRNLDDSAVVKEKPRYMTKLDGKGNFTFNNLAPGTFAMYALPNDYSRRYDDTTKLFAFADSAINSVNNSPVTLYAYQLPKLDTAKRKTAPAAKESGNEKKETQLRFKSTITGGRLGLFDTLTLTFTKPLTKFDTTKLVLTDNNLQPIANYRIIGDTSHANFSILYNWAPDTQYNLLLDKTGFADSAGLTLLKSDTLAFSTKRNEDYGSIRLRFSKLDFSKNPVLQIVEGNKVIDSSPILQRDWYRKLFEPGEYELRILYDTNKNGKWDPGKFFDAHRQPEVVTSLDTKLSIRANWDNEKDIILK